MSVFTSSPCSAVLLCAVAATCILQVALAMPVPVGQYPHFTMSSPVSGRFVRMLKTKIVDGNGLEPTTANDSALWDLRMVGSSHAFENVAYPGHYLTMAVLGNSTVLFGHEIGTLPSLSYVESLLRPEEADVSGSGHLAEESEMPTAASDQDEAEFVVLSTWHLVTLGAPRVRLQAVTENRDCFLAFDSYGQPESNLCEVPEDSESVPINFLPFFH